MGKGGNRLHAVAVVAHGRHHRLIVEGDKLRNLSGGKALVGVDEKGQFSPGLMTYGTRQRTDRLEISRLDHLFQARHLAALEEEFMFFQHLSVGPANGNLVTHGQFDQAINKNMSRFL